MKKTLAIILFSIAAAANAVTFAPVTYVDNRCSQMLTNANRYAESLRYGDVNTNDVVSLINSSTGVVHTLAQWAKEPNKPIYTAYEVGARPNDWMPMLVQLGAQTNLVSGENIKTINNQSILGGGNLDIGGYAANGIVWTNNALRTMDGDKTVRAVDVGALDYRATNAIAEVKQDKLPWHTNNIPKEVLGLASWAKAENPPEGMTQNAVIISNDLAYTKGGTNVTAAMVGALPADTPIPTLPANWPLSSVTNAQGGAVGAADVGALPVTGGMITNATLSSPSVLRIGNNGIEKLEEEQGGDGYVGELHIGGNGASGMYYPGDGGTGKIYIGGFGYGGGNGEVYIGANNEYGGSGKLVVGGYGGYYDGQGEIIVRGNDQNAATVTIGDVDNGGVLTVGGSDVITANTTNSFAQGIVSVAMSATASYLTQTNITELTPYGADSIVGKIHSAPSPAGAAVAKSTIEYNASGTACIVTIAAGGQLAATTTGWPNGQATTAIITIGAGATIADNISLVGYGSWPVGEAFIASCVYYNSMVRVVPIQKVQ